MTYNNNYKIYKHVTFHLNILYYNVTNKNYYNICINTVKFIIINIIINIV